MLNVKVERETMANPVGALPYEGPSIPGAISQDFASEA
ncbi:hypothetical protein Lepto7375DRAFT_6121 [Leptolyngbya sp. PCC 7375]|nr:hypothetical protein Lepto7375DRAFT_6121 [Leptolyngbya sp. PCC 7375]